MHLSPTSKLGYLSFKNNANAAAVFKCCMHQQKHPKHEQQLFILLRLPLLKLV